MEDVQKTVNVSQLFCLFWLLHAGDNTCSVDLEQCIVSVFLHRDWFLLFSARVDS